MPATTMPAPSPAPPATRGFPPELQVKQFVAEVNGAFGSRWRVFTTGSSRHYYFQLIQNTDIAKPVLKTDLQDDVRRALAHGYGHAPAPTGAGQ